MPPQIPLRNHLTAAILTGTLTHFLTGIDIIPVFVIFDDKPVRASRLSAHGKSTMVSESVGQCWKAKAHTYRADERVTAEASYEATNLIYRRILEESSQDWQETED